MTKEITGPDGRKKNTRVTIGRFTIPDRMPDHDFDVEMIPHIKNYQPSIVRIYELPNTGSITPVHLVKSPCLRVQGQKGG
ncbi:MAG: hypothetical protein PHU23_05670 [Dehalococcoidales bacterium]|nr:hypothetical protein [Dehalococcoidales bacterium]